MDHTVTTNQLIFFVNGKKIKEQNPNPEWTLGLYLRTKLKLCGTKIGCNEGACGACTVMLSKYDHKNNTIKHNAINACLAPVCSLHGCAVTTVEGIGSTRTRLHPVQERIAKAHGSQCGFCTPGFVMSMYTLLRNNQKPSMHDLETQFQGNLCRCTGYRPIIDGFRVFTKCDVNNCCRTQFKNNLFEKSNYRPYDESQEPIFPPDLKINALTYWNDFLKFEYNNLLWLRPVNIQQLGVIQQQFGAIKIVGGNTEIGVETKLKNVKYPVLVNIHNVDELNGYECKSTGISFGANTTLDQFESILNGEINKCDAHKVRIFVSIVDMLHWFAGKQIRNVATIAGNIVTSSPISDLNPILMAVGATVKLLTPSKMTIREIQIDENFFLSYRTNAIRSDEILVSIFIPYTDNKEYCCALKQSKRKNDDIAIVNSAVFVKIKSNNIIESIRIVFGGMAPVTRLASNTCKQLLGCRWNETILDTVFHCLLDEFPLPPNAPGGMIKYRQTLLLSLFFKSFLTITQSLTPSEDTMNGFELSKSHIQCAQYYSHVPTDQIDSDAVGRPIVHMSAFKQACGTAVYGDDIPTYQNELHLSYVLSKKCYARIKRIDASEALKLSGVQCFLSAENLAANKNKWGLLVPDEQIFADNYVVYQGQVIGAIVSDSHRISQKAISLVQIEYDDDINSKPIITIEDAIAHNSYLCEPKVLIKGDCKQVFTSNNYFIIQGQCRTGSQDHFYLEPQTVLVNPRLDDNEIDIFASSQDLSTITKSVADLLDIPENHVYAKVKRVGGGFGGKCSRTVMFTLPVALAAYQLNTPVRCTLERWENMQMIGGRHPFLFKYKVAFTKSGKIEAAQLFIYLNAGHSLDTSSLILAHAMQVMTNAYNIPNIELNGYVCKTNLPSNTAFRGFGAPQGIFSAENIIRHVADYLQLDYLQVIRLNLMKTGDLTIINEPLRHCTVELCIDECLKRSNYYEQLQQIHIFNRQHHWKKRGISLVPLLYGVGFEAMFMNQGAALVHIYRDGSVLISHGGVEMGQGLHTKMVQVASHELGIDHSNIYVSETNTKIVPNTITSGASASTDLYGFAVLKACQVLKERLQPYIKNNPDGKWIDWVQAAFFDRISLSANGFYKVPLHMVHETSVGKYYWSMGAGCTQVEIDCLTGDHRLLRTDIVMDIGQSLNPAIDIGQIEGGFIQGYGLFTMEEMLYTSDGIILTRGPGTYKIPSMSDIPHEFNVTIIKGGPDERAVYSSKAIGEPPLCLGMSTFFAIKEAVKFARANHHSSNLYQFDAPATVERIRMACQDAIVSKVLKK